MNLGLSESRANVLSEEGEVTVRRLRGSLIQNIIDFISHREKVTKAIEQILH